MIGNNPQWEDDRLATLRTYGALSDIPYSSFERLTRLAACLFSAPIAMVTFVEEHRVIIKSSVGLDVWEAQREDTFCPYAVLSDEPLTVVDAAMDPRFSHLPIVVGEPHLRFFAGAPLITREGFRLGTLCVLDTVPRSQVDATSVSLLQDLAAQAMELLQLHVSNTMIVAMQAELHEQRKQLEESRELWRKTERRAMLALHAGHMGYWEHDPITDLVTLSASLSAILGLPRVEHTFTMDEWLATVDEQDRPTVLETIDRAQKTQQNFLLKYRTRGPDGSDRWLSSSGTYYADAQGRFGAQGVSWDSTAAENAARQLAMSEELFRELSESAPMGVYRADLAGRVTYVNPRIAEIWKKPAQQLLGLGWCHDVHNEDRASVLNTIAIANANRTQTEFECRLVLADGTVRWISVRSSLLLDSSGEPIGKIGTVDDITQRREVIKELQAAKEAAEIANRTKDMFLANVSHELRTPLNGVLGMAELLLDSKLTPDQVDMAEVIRGSGRSLLSLVNDMLDVGRIEAGTILIERKAFALPQLIRKSISVLDPELKEKRLRIVCTYPEDLPSSLVGDPQRIEQILLNYLSNAVKFSATGEILLNVSGVPPAGTLQTSATKEITLLLSVTDKGPGIAPESQAKLFRPFSQVDASPTRRTGGVGLGLAIAKRLAELMGGSVGLDSALGQGSTFWVRLPLTVDTGSEQRKLEASDVQAEPAGRILLAEDNLINQKVTLAALRRLGWSADVATDGLAAISLFRANEYALVLMDCHMPEMDGLMATAEIRAWENQRKRAPVPVVALTANAMKGDRERCLAVGMNDHLTKPFGIAELRDVLARWTTMGKLTRD